jgi:hypothetical protein
LELIFSVIGQEGQPEKATNKKSQQVHLPSRIHISSVGQNHVVFAQHCWQESPTTAHIGSVFTQREGAPQPLLLPVVNRE